jgi:hypothetical protein
MGGEKARVDRKVLDGNSPILKKQIMVGSCRPNFKRNSTY